MLNSSGQRQNFVFFVISLFPALHHVSYHRVNFFHLFLSVKTLTDLRVHQVPSLKKIKLNHHSYIAIHMSRSQVFFF